MLGGEPCDGLASHPRGSSNIHATEMGSLAGKQTLRIRNDLKKMLLSLAEGKIRLWSFTTTDHIQGVVKFEIGEILLFKALFSFRC